MRGMEVKELRYEEEGEEQEESLLLNFFLDCREAMGANMINTTAEYLAPQIETITGGKVIFFWFQRERKPRRRFHRKPRRRFPVFLFLFFPLFFAPLFFGSFCVFVSQDSRVFLFFVVARRRNSVFNFFSYH